MSGWSYVEGTDEYYKRLERERRLRLITEMEAQLLASPFTGLFSDACFQIPSARDASVWKLYPLIDVSAPEVKEFLTKGGLSQEIIENLSSRSPIYSSSDAYIKVFRLLNDIKDKKPLDKISTKSRSFHDRDGETAQSQITYAKDTCQDLALKTYQPSYGGEFCYSIKTLNTPFGYKTLYQYYGIE